MSSAVLWVTKESFWGNLYPYIDELVKTKVENLVSDVVFWIEITEDSEYLVHKSKKSGDIVHVLTWWSQISSGSEKLIHLFDDRPLVIYTASDGPLPQQRVYLQLRKCDIGAHLEGVLLT